MTAFIEELLYIMIHLQSHYRLYKGPRVLCSSSSQVYTLLAKTLLILEAGLGLLSLVFCSHYRTELTRVLRVSTVQNLVIEIREGKYMFK
jgi:hypothetical protein